jgi:hypothetical protein
MGLFWAGSHIASPTLIAATIETISNATLTSNNHTYSSPLLDTDGTLPLRIQNVYLLLLISLPLVWLYANLQSERNAEQAAAIDLETRIWRHPWLTTDWEVLYGLIGLANDNKWTSRTPFHGYPRLYPVWHAHNRPWCKRLLAMGIIPLFVQDGGMCTYRRPLRGCSRTSKFPWFKTPLYQQGKRRAYMEFLIPHPEAEPKRMQFLNSLLQNRDGPCESHQSTFSYGVAVRFGPNGPAFTSDTNPPEHEDLPFEVGASSWLGPLVPFKRDSVLEGGHGKHVNGLENYVRRYDVSKVPLLQHAPTVLVRMEAKHFAPEELDHFVFALAQEAGLDVQWPELLCREAAIAEIERFGLPTDGLMPYDISVPDRYH